MAWSVQSGAFVLLDRIRVIGYNFFVFPPADEAGGKIFVYVCKKICGSISETISVKLAAI